MKICKVEGCFRKHHSKGYCKRHKYHIVNFGKIIKTVHEPNTFIIENVFCKIVLLNKYGDFVGNAIIDIEDYKIVKKYKWYFNQEYVRSKFDNKFYMLHNIVMKHTSSKDVIVDHINGDGLDNRKSNLRICTHAENCRNSKKPKNNTSKYKGVYKSSDGKKWVASIGYANKRIYLGRYNSLKEAAIIYNEASEKYHGSYGRKN